MSSLSSSASSKRFAHCVARAVFDNVAEAPDELSFRKGDLLTVLEQNTSGLQGWWLCSLRGRQGICPANRLRIVPRLYDATGGMGDVCGYTGSVATSRRELRMGSEGTSSTSDESATSSVGTYDVPRNIYPRVHLEDYDTPRRSTLGKDLPNLSLNNSDYDVPRQHGAFAGVINNLSGRSSGISILSSGSSSGSSVSSCSSESLSLSSVAASTRYGFTASSRSSISSIETYDVPRPLSSSNDPDKAYDELCSTSCYNAAIICPTPSPLPTLNPETEPKTTEISLENPEVLEKPDSVPLTIDTALETALNLDGQVCSITRNLLCPWKTSKSPQELRENGVRLRTTLEELLNFCKEINIAAQKHGAPPDILLKLERIVRLLRASYEIVQNTTKTLDANGWIRQTQVAAPDELSRLVACSRNLADDVHQVTSLIQNHGNSLFPKNLSLSRRLIEEYDYVVLESKAKVDVTNEDVKQRFQTNLHGHSDICVVEPESTPTPLQVPREPADFSNQVVTTFSSLTQAIDAFIVAVEHNQPPQVFITYSKLVILNAHKLLCTGDSARRNAAESKIKSALLERTNQLCHGLQECVRSIKRASTEFPDVVPIKAMLDSVVALSQTARELKIIILQSRETQ